MFNSLNVITVDLRKVDERYRKALYEELYLDSVDSKNYIMSMLNTVRLIKAIICVSDRFSDTEYAKDNTNILINSNFDELFEHICDDLKLMDIRENRAFMECISPKIQALIKLC